RRYVSKNVPYVPLVPHQCLLNIVPLVPPVEGVEENPRTKIDTKLSILFAPRLLRSEEHTSELQSPCNLVCRLLLEKKKKKYRKRQHPPHPLLQLPLMPPRYSAFVPRPPLPLSRHRRILPYNSHHPLILLRLFTTHF